MHSPVEPQLEYVFTITAEIERPRSAGLSPMGERLHIPIIGGTVTGPKLKGRILPGGSDWPIIGSDGNSTIEAHYSIEADDGTLIYVVNKAKRVSSPEITSRLRSGAIIEPDQYYMRGAPVFDAPDGPHSWLRNRIFICSLAPAGKQIKIDVYVVL
jgi:hypothetical protein